MLLKGAWNVYLFGQRKKCEWFHRNTFQEFLAPTLPDKATEIFLEPDSLLFWLQLKDKDIRHNYAGMLLCVLITLVQKPGQDILTRYFPKVFFCRVHQQAGTHYIELRICMEEFSQARQTQKSRHEAFTKIHHSLYQLHKLNVGPTRDRPLSVSTYGWMFSTGTQPFKYLLYNAF